MRIFEAIRKLTPWKRKTKVVECDHVFWPVPDGKGWYTGQQCALCPQFNSMKDLGLPEEAPNARR